MAIIATTFIMAKIVKMTITTTTATIAITKKNSTHYIMCNLRIHIFSTFLLCKSIAAPGYQYSIFYNNVFGL